MITLQELCRSLDELLQSDLFSDSCPNGLQVEGTPEITSIATAVSAGLSTIEAAIKIGAQALLVHHGLFWNRDSFVVSGVKRQKLILLLKSGISLIAYHLPLDAHKDIGNNWKAAHDLGWSDLEPFGLYNGMTIGVKGKMKPVPREDFAKTLQEYYHHPTIMVPGGPKQMESVALISGGAHRSIVEAAKERIDGFITGSYDEPTWYQSFEEKINFFAMGHSATERIGPRALGEHLARQHGLRHTFIDNANPF